MLGTMPGIGQLAGRVDFRKARHGPSAGRADHQLSPFLAPLGREPCGAG